MDQVAQAIKPSSQAFGKFIGIAMIILTVIFAIAATLYLQEPEVCISESGSVSGVIEQSIQSEQLVPITPHLVWDWISQ